MTLWALLAVSLGAGAQAAAASTPYPGGRWEPGPPKYGTAVLEDVPVVMDDGVVLDASVTYPTDLATGQRAAGRFPVVIEHTPYPTANSEVRYHAQYGYIGVAVNDRGTWSSGGTGELFTRRAAQDGVNIVRWAARDLEGSDGRVALTGCSWPGANALENAALVGPNSPVKAVVARCIGLESIHRDVWMTSGIPAQGISATFVAPQLLMGNNPSTVQWYRDLGNEIMRGGPAAYDGAFWRDRLPLSQAQQIVDNRIPVLLWTGWQDNVENAALRTYTAFQNASSRRPIHAPMSPYQPTSPRYQIIAGPWGHGGGADSGIVLQWLETWLRGVDTGIQKTRTPMHLFERGTERWVNAAQFPTTLRYTDVFPGRGQTLTAAGPGKPDGDTLSWGDPAQQGNRLSYTTEPLSKGLTLSGPMSATIHASVSNTNLELITGLYDVAPDGTSTQITTGTMLGSQRELDRRKSWTDRNGKSVWPWQSLERDEYLRPGRPYAFNVRLEARQWGLRPGHRLRLELTTQPPAGTCPGPDRFSLGFDPCYLNEPQQATVPGGRYRILYGRAFPTRLTLPIQPAFAFETRACSVTPTSNNVCQPQEW